MSRYGTYDPETGEYTNIAYRNRSEEDQDLTRKEYRARRSAEAERLGLEAEYGDDTEGMYKAIYDADGTGDYDMEDTARLVGAGSNRGVNRVSAKDLKNELKYNVGDTAVPAVVGALTPELATKQAIIDQNQAMLEANPDIKQGAKAQGLLAKWVAEIDDYNQRNSNPFDEDPDDGEVVIDDPIVEDSVDLPPAVVVDPPPVVVADPEPIAEVIVNPVVTTPGSGISNVNTIVQTNEQEAIAKNVFGDVTNVGNGNVISGNGSLVIDNSQVGGDNTAINNSVQLADITNGSTVYNPYTGAQEVNLFKPGSFELDLGAIAEKFKTQPFMSF